MTSLKKSKLISGQQGRQYRRPGKFSDSTYLETFVSKRSKFGGQRSITIGLWGYPNRSKGFSVGLLKTSGQLSLKNEGRKEDLGVNCVGKYISRQY